MDSPTVNDRSTSISIWPELTVLLFLAFGGCHSPSEAILQNTAIRGAQVDPKGEEVFGQGRGNLFFRPPESSAETISMVRLASLDVTGRSSRNHNDGLDPTTIPAGMFEQRKRDIVKFDYLEELPRATWANAKAVLRKPTNLLILGAAGAGSIWGELDFDDHVDKQLRGRKIINRDWTIATGVAGNPATHFGLATAVYAHGLVTKNSQTYDFGKTLTQALVLNGLTTLALKVAVFNEGPNGGPLAWPSGHTSSTMTIAAVVDEYYGTWAAAPLYAVTGLVMYERLISGEHWASDVIFGAVLGYVIGHTVAGQRNIQVMGMDVVPYVDPYSGSSGIGLVKTW